MKPRNYQCRKCGKINQITTLFGMFITPHLGWRKWIKCEHCGAKRHFQRRIFQPEMKIREELKQTQQVVCAHQETIETLFSSRNATQDKLEEAQAELKEANNYLAARDKKIEQLECKLEEAEIKTAKKIFADIEQNIGKKLHIDDHMRTYAKDSSVSYKMLAELKKKYKVED